MVSLSKKSFRARRSLLVTLTLLAALVPASGVLAAAASASVPDQLTISVTKPLGDLSPGVFVATGGISDFGGFLQSDYRCVAANAPTIAVCHYADTFTGGDGTMVASLNSITTFAAFPVLVEDGVWMLTGGTGSYLGLHGQGKFHKVVDIPNGTVTITFVGKVH